MFAGEGDMSKIKIPCDNGPYRDGKGSLYEGGTRVPALANWPGHIKPGAAVDGMIHVVDMYPTLAGGGGRVEHGAASLSTAWTSGRRSRRARRRRAPRSIYNIELFRAGVRQGDWKLVWRAPLPSTPELYNIVQDPSEKANLAAQNPEQVLALQQRANELAEVMAKSPLLQAEFDAMRKRIAMPPALPGEEFQFNLEPEAKPSPDRAKK